jgi:hypothetical protein
MSLPGGADKAVLGVALAMLAQGFAAEPAGADAAMLAYRSMFAETARLDCPAASRDEVVVCAPRQGETDPNRLPLPFEPAPGDRARLMAGEAPSGTPALRLGRESCSAVGPYQRCSGGLPVFQVIYVMKEAVEAIVDPDD